MSFDLVSQSEDRPDYFDEQQWEKGYRAHLSGGAWSKALNLAVAYGWTPAGTLTPPHWQDPGFMEDAGWKVIPEWDGGYNTNDGQLVTAEDAKALADALENSLDDIPDCEMPSILKEVRMGEPNEPTGEPVIDHLLLSEFASALPEPLSFIIPNVHLHPFEFFGGKNKQCIKQLISLCQKGSFTIW